MSMENLLAVPKLPPNLYIPPSSNVVKVSIIDTTTRMLLHISMFVTPIYPNCTHVNAPAYSFLIEHASGKNILFDLALRRDWENSPPIIVDHVKLLGSDLTIEVEKDVATILDEQGFGRENINQIIWSHDHWDHTGDPSTFPPSTDLVVGPGFKDAYTPGYPENPEGTLCSSAWEGRKFIEISFEKDGQGLKIGRFNALDYFGDGSFYLLDTPGHTIGHLCGLARTTTNPDTFVYMGGDTCHHSGEFRPTPYLPLPKEISPSPISHLHASACPGALFQHLQRNQKPDEPFFAPTEQYNWDTKLLSRAIEGMKEFDAHEEVLTIIAHDESLLEVLDFFPKRLNEWKSKDFATKGMWRFLTDFGKAVEKKSR